MLPFLKKRQEAQISGLQIKNREPDEKPEQDQDDSSAAIEACAAALISAIHSHDAKGVAEAMKDAFEILESMPHEEVEPHSYDAQNIKAGENE